MMLYCDKQELKKKSKDELVDELYDSLVENEQLKRELRKYKNPNTPPSAHPHFKPLVKPSARCRKRGAPLDHKGVTKPRKANGELRLIVGESCPNCGSADLSVGSQRNQ